MPKKEMGSWTAVQMYCPNCGTLNVGYKDQEGKYRFRCKRCTVVLLRSYKNRRQDVIEITLPSLTTMLSTTLRMKALGTEGANFRMYFS